MVWWGGESAYWRLSYLRGCYEYIFKEVFEGYGLGLRYRWSWNMGVELMNPYEESCCTKCGVV